MNNLKNRGLAFIAVAMAFLAVGLTTNKAFLGVAIAFLALGISFIVRSKRASNN